MKDGFKVIDADRHILEPSDLYQNYLPEKFKSRVRLAGPNQTVREVDGKPVSDSAIRPGRVTEDYGYIFSASKRWRECFADAYANKFDPASNIRDMEREGLFPRRFPLNPSGKGRAVGHLESEVDDWIVERAASRLIAA